MATLARAASRCRRPAVAVRASAAPAKIPKAAAAAAAAAAAVLLSCAPALAADLALGTQVFNGNCAACHQGGMNSVINDHTLQKAAIEKYLEGGFNVEAIEYQVRNGKGAMPAWEGRLDDDEIVAVTGYVYDQAAGDKW